MSDHYFSRSPEAAAHRRDVTVRAWGRSLSMQSASGTFSSGGLDKATALLLAELAPPGDGVLLDLGCGWGPIACALAAAAPTAEVWALDVNERARELTAANAARLGVAVRVAAPQEVPPDVCFNEIWSNPPIRIGKAALHTLLVTWLARLAPGGVANLVVGKNLGADSLQRWITDQGYPTQRLASSQGFRILRSVKS